MNFPCYATSVMAGSFFPARWHTWFKHCIQQETAENQFYLSKYEFSDWFKRRILKLLLVIQKLQACPFYLKYSHLTRFPREGPGGNVFRIVHAISQKGLNSQTFTIPEYHSMTLDQCPILCFKNRWSSKGSWHVFQPTCTNMQLIIHAIRQLKS